MIAAHGGPGSRKAPDAPRVALAARIVRAWSEAPWTGPGERIVVAVSGGLDSLVLLHLLRFRARELGADLVVAHFDHRMRDGSGADARWVRGIAGAWGVPVHVGRARALPGDEAEARTLRYDFLWRVVSETGAARLVTAHHADDQAETILFRLLRGAGVEGLAGMRRLRPPGLLRPLLAEPRAELERYARRSRLRARQDPTNRDTARARNRIRHELLPALEAVHPGARDALLRMGRNAGRTAEALDLLLRPFLDEVVRARGETRLTFDRDRFLAHPPPIRNALLRALAREARLRLGEAGTVAALEFINTGPSGGRLHLPGSARLARDFELLHLEWALERPPAGAEGDAGAPLVLSGPDEGRCRLRVGDGEFRVAWGEGAPGVDREEPASPREEGGRSMTSASFDPAALRFPLTIRAWLPGDRTRGRAGSRKLKKLFGELRVPRARRGRVPVVADGHGEIIWVAGLHRAPVAPTGPDTRSWTLWIWHHDSDG